MLQKLPLCQAMYTTRSEGKILCEIFILENLNLNILEIPKYQKVWIPQEFSPRISKEDLPRASSEILR